MATVKEAAINLIKLQLQELPNDVSKEEVEAQMGHRVRQTTVDRVKDEIRKQKGRIDKLFAPYLDNLERQRREHSQ